MPEHYFSDPDDGMTPDNCHPRFAQLAPDDFFYAGDDDFSPFGSDDGHDTLSFLEDWYRDGGQSKNIVTFLTNFLAGWDSPVPKAMLKADFHTLGKWLNEVKINDTYLQAECRVRVATAFGQLRIVGSIEPRMLEEGLIGLRCQLLLNERARTVYPEWKYADLDRTRLLAMQSVLKQIKSMATHATRKVLGKQ